MENTCLIQLKLQSRGSLDSGTGEGPPLHTPGTQARSTPRTWESGQIHSTHLGIRPDPRHTPGNQARSTPRTWDSGQIHSTHLGLRPDPRHTPGTQARSTPRTWESGQIHATYLGLRSDPRHAPGTQARSTPDPTLGAGAGLAGIHRLMGSAVHPGLLLSQPWHVGGVECHHVECLLHLLH